MRNRIHDLYGCLWLQRGNMQFAFFRIFPHFSAIFFLLWHNFFSRPNPKYSEVKIGRKILSFFFFENKWFFRDSRKKVRKSPESPDGPGLDPGPFGAFSWWRHNQSGPVDFSKFWNDARLDQSPPLDRLDFLDFSSFTIQFDWISQFSRARNSMNLVLPLNFLSFWNDARQDPRPALDRLDFLDFFSVLF